MKKTIWMTFWSLIISFSLVFIPIGTVTAAGTGFTTTITYQNVGLDIAHVTILYYPEGQSTPISIPRPDLPVGGSASVSIGNLETTPASFRGSAVVKSDVEIAVLMSQIPTTVTVKARPLSSATGKGSASVWFLPIQKIAASTSLVSVQNLDKNPANIKFTFFGGALPITISKNNIPSGGSAYVDLSAATEIPTGFLGGIQVDSVRSGTTTPGKISGVSFYSAGSATGANTTESQTTAASKLYMPVAMCAYTGGMATTYYVFNTDPVNPATVTAKYNTLKVQTQIVPALSGRFFHGCAPSGTASGFYGYATITSNGPLLLATGLIENAGMSATFIGQASGVSKLALPFAQYSTANFTNGQRVRTVTSVMNTGANLAAGAVKARYYGKDGTLVGTVSLPALASGVRVDTIATQIGSAGSEFGYYADGSTGGSLIIEGPAGSSLMAVGLVTSVAGTGIYSGEAYNAIPPLGTP